MITDSLVPGRLCDIRTASRFDIATGTLAFGATESMSGVCVFGFLEVAALGTAAGQLH